MVHGRQWPVEQPDGERSPSGRGWNELERGDWVLAARTFDSQIENDEHDAGALEGRAWAAWWLNDAEQLFALRERAFHAHRRRDDRVSAARLAVWLGCDHHDFRGDHAIANAWYRRAHRLLDGLPISVEHAWLAFQEGAYALELVDDVDTAKRLAQETIEIARTLGHPDLVFLGLALEGLALVTQGDVEGGMQRLDEASLAATSGEFRERIPRTWTLCYMIYACERVRDFDRTAQWCRRMEEIASASGSDFALGVCQAHYGGVLVFGGDWDRAERELQASATTLARVRPPAVAEADARLGELRLRQGRYEESAELFQRSMPHPLAALGLARIALEVDDAVSAVDLAEDLIEQTPAVSITQRSDALQILAEAHARLGDVASARSAAEALDRIASVVGNRPLQAMASVASAAVERASGDARSARRHLERAADLFERGGLPYESAVARGELAIELGSLGRTDDATREAERAVRRLEELGGRRAGDRIASRRRASPQGSGSPVPGLTARESEVLEALAGGLTDREIAVRLTISAHTVHRHVANILRKLGVPTRAAAAALAGRHGVGE